MRISDWSSDVCSSDLPQDGSGLALYSEVAIVDEQIDRVVTKGHSDPAAEHFLIGDTAHERGRVTSHPVALGAPAAHVLQSRRVGTLPSHASGADNDGTAVVGRSEEHTSELQSLMRTSYAV